MADPADVLKQVKFITGKGAKLRSNWSTRNKKMKDWYNILTLKDELAQEGMESVTSNDPRTGYNLGKHLMSSSIIAHKIPSEEMDTPEVDATSYLESYVTKRWASEEKRYRQMGRQSQIGEIIAFMLATGWFAVFSMADGEHVWNEVWNPYEVFPAFGQEGLIENVNAYNMDPSVANRKAKLMGWDIDRPFTHKVALYNYWGFDNDGDVANGIVLGSKLVKPLVKDVALSKVGRLPVFISPVGGLPDTGAIMDGKRYQEHYGEALVATNEELSKNYNRMLTFAQQLMRDTANPRWFETSSGDTPILREEDMFKRGSIFRGAPGEDVGPLPVPPIPVELRTMLMDYQNMAQRGLFPWVIFGNIQQQMSYLAMANVASAALQVLTPYMDGLRGLLSDIDNYWTQLILDNDYTPYGFEKPDDLPDPIEFDVQADIEIPGYLIQRANVARMLDPTFKLATTTVMDRLFPEIRDSNKEVAKTRKDAAMMHPKAILVDQIVAYRQRARELKETNDPTNVETANLYEKLADSLEAEIVGVPPVPEQPVVKKPGLLQEVLPKEGNTPLEGLGRSV